ncbi:hypothetical protein BJV77DRAFT_1000999, partial [Russula vinacea]
MLMNSDSWEHDMDNLILEATICQDEHCVNRSASPKIKLSGLEPHLVCLRPRESHGLGN